MKVTILADFPVECLPGRRPSCWGQGATWLPPLARALESFARENEIHWVTCSKAVRNGAIVDAWGQRFHLLPRGSLALEILSGFRRERRGIRRVIGEVKPDLVHAWGSEQGYGLAAMESGMPWLISMQGLLQLLCKRSAQPLLLRVQARHERPVLRNAGHLTCESSWAEREIRPYAPTARVERLTYGLDPEWFDVVRAPDPEPLVLFVGTLSKSKGVDTLLEAFRDPRLAAMKLVLLGDGPLRGVSCNQIRFEGPVSRDRVREWMARSWVLAHPTRADACPNSVKEARVTGLPVVSTREGGQVDWIEDGLSGMFHEVGDVKGLVEGLLHCAESAVKSLTMGSHNRKACREMADPATTAARLADIWQRAWNEG